MFILPRRCAGGRAATDYLGDVVLEFDINGAFGHLQLAVVGIAREVAALDRAAAASAMCSPSSTASR